MFILQIVYIDTTPLMMDKCRNNCVCVWSLEMSQHIVAIPNIRANGNFPKNITKDTPSSE